jgi:predicted signal transduction protein with EAL and GGDEF domain
VDVPLYAIALVVFALLYLAIGVFLAFTLIIALVVMFSYLAIRHGSLPENYPHSLGDTLITVIFIGVTWGIFVFLAPKNPIPFIGHGFTYTSSTVLPLGSLIVIAFVLCLIFLLIGSFIAKDLRQLGGGTGGGQSMADQAAASESKPKQGVGA